MENGDETEIYNSLVDILYKEKYDEYKFSAKQIRDVLSYNTIAENVFDDCLS